MYLIRTSLNSLKGIKKIRITSKEASLISGVPLRTYMRYENDDNYGDYIKRKYIILSLKERFEITEEKGILTIEMIKKIVAEVFF